MSYPNPNQKNTAMREKMGKLFPNKNETFQEDNKSFLPNVNRIGADGVDHILLDANGADPVGRALSFNYRGYYDHPILGGFASLKSLWYYCRSRDRVDRLRDLVGRNLVVFAHKLPTTRMSNIQAVILDAIYMRVIKDQAAIVLIKKSELPFDLYSIENEYGMRRRLPESEWMIRGCEEIRKAIKEDRQPDLTSFMDTPDQDLHQFLVAEFIDPLANLAQSIVSEDDPEEALDGQAEPAVPALLASGENAAEEAAGAQEEQSASSQELIEEEQAMAEVIPSSPEAYLNMPAASLTHNGYKISHNKH